uniref:Sulfatase N-terminal domain-containing protein n=1 Tax=Magnetococcus massalia (strain MO-1) TaxID=451514 RepID=A0A1S7LC14_MAGMO|nr:Membrane protein of unknown function [Candidatus Magnetococcus massalia]
MPGTYRTPYSQPSIFHWLLLATALLFLAAQRGELWEMWHFEGIITWESYLSLATSLAACLLLVMVLSLWRPLLLLFLPITFIALTASNYFYLHFNVVTNANSIGALWETHWFEAREFLTSQLLLELSVAALVSLLLLRWALHIIPSRPISEQFDLLKGLALLFIGPLLLLLLNPELRWLVRWEELPRLDLFSLIATLFIYVILKQTTIALRHPLFIPGVLITLWLLLLLLGLSAPYHDAYRASVWMILASGLFLPLWGELQQSAPSDIAAKKTRSGNQRRSLIQLTTLTLFASSSLMVNLFNLPPFTILGAHLDYLAQKERLFKALKEKKSIADLPSQFTQRGDDPLTIVIIVGESSRGDRFQLNGYHRPTNPLLMQQKNLTSFPLAFSCYPSTRFAVPCMFTSTHRETLAKLGSESSLIDLFNKHGFESYWLSMAYRYSSIDMEITVVSEDVKHIRHISPVHMHDPENLYDEALLPWLDQSLAAEPKRNKLIILHTMGSHWSYDLRYPDTFRHFEPTCPGYIAIKECHLDDLSNAYDNSIRYTDFVINQVISRLREKQAMVIYTSDHGQSLGEDGFYTHGNEDRWEQWHIPFIWWFSQPFKALYPQQVEALASKRQLTISHDHLFHSLLNCAGLDSSVVDQRLSLCTTGRFQQATAPM